MFIDSKLWPKPRMPESKESGEMPERKESTKVSVPRKSAEKRLTMAEQELAYADTAIVADSEQRETEDRERNRYNDLIAATVPLLFPRALTNGQVEVAYSLLEKAHECRLDNYQTMKKNFLLFLDSLLSRKSEANEAYRNYLLKMKRVVEEERFDRYEELEEVSDGSLMAIMAEDGPGEMQNKYEEIQRETIIPVGFAQAIDRKQPDFAYEFMCRAQAMKLPDFAEMKKKFLAFIDEEVARTESVSTEENKKRLMRIKKRVEDDFPG